MKLWWLRFPKDASANMKYALTRPLAYAVVGGTGAGKSALVENIADKYAKVIDLFGSRDNEGLGWLRSPRKDNCLLLKGNSVTVDCNCAHVINASDLTLKNMEEFSAIISVSAFYRNLQEEWYSLTKIMDKLWHRGSWKEPWCLVIREASNLIYSRLSLGETQTMAKNYLIYVVREMRHCGFAVALDTIRWMGLDIELRSIADYTFIKAQGIDGLPRSLRFMYRYFKPSGIMRSPVHAYAMVSRKGPLGFGISTCPPWHKKEKENLIDHFAIRLQYGEVPYEPEGRMQKVGDYEHVRIVKHRIELAGKRKGKPISMDDMAKIIGRSAGTIHRHINAHNNMVHSVGECDKCQRVGSPFAKTPCD